MTTGIVRAALSAVVAEVARHPGCRVLSATTDGCMIAVPRTFAVSVDSAGKVVPPAVREAIPGLLERFKDYFPVECLEHGRLNMGLPADTWLEIKHVGDRALTVKTRMYALTYHGVKQHLAHVGLQIDDADALEALYYAPDIMLTELGRLASLRSIIEDEQADLVWVTEHKRSNTDFDFKRIPLPEGGTRPPVTVDEVFAHRQHAKAIRRRSEGSARATITAVLLKDAGLTPHAGSERDIRRTVHRAIFHDQAGWRPHGMTDAEIGRRLGITSSDVKNQKRRRFQPHSLPDLPRVRAIMAEEAAKLGMRVTKPMLRVLLRDVTSPA